MSKPEAFLRSIHESSLLFPGSLRFITKRAGENETLVWMRHGTQGNKWRFADLTFQSQSPLQVFWWICFVAPYLLRHVINLDTHDQHRDATLNIMGSIMVFSSMVQLQCPDLTQSFLNLSFWGHWVCAAAADIMCHRNTLPVNQSVPALQWLHAF